ncbi:hypothetical protein EV368DRAFT_84302 [Lentinula lateritia]|nr:hypothetical protein EV368DRAFT_84302 [Lentinula lateritia]
MLGKLRKKHAKDEAYVIIQMKKPVQTIITATVESVIDEDESSDDDFPGPVVKKRDNTPGVSWTQIPLSSVLFHASQAINKPTSLNTPSTSATALPALPATPIYPSGYPNMPMVSQSIRDGVTKRSNGASGRAERLSKR